MDWLPGATRRDGPVAKHGYNSVTEPREKKGVVFHSMEGSLTAALGELDKLSREASWTFSNPKTGPMLQHYPLGFHTWASGSQAANIMFTSIEHEGMAGEALTESQVQNDFMLLGWMGLDWRRPTSDSDMTATLYEHRECTRFGSAATACPSGRIPWGKILAAQEEDMGIEFSSAVNFGNEGPGLPKEAVALADLLARYRRDIYAIRADVAALRTLGGSGPLVAKFPGATVQVPPMDVPVEEA